MFDKNWVDVRQTGEKNDSHAGAAAEARIRSSFSDVKYMCGWEFVPCIWIVQHLWMHRQGE